MPQGQSSLVDDAPGWSNNADTGPTCWKCRGAGVKKTKQRPLAQEDTDTALLAIACPVCQGSGHLSVKQGYCEDEAAPGMVTRGRRRPHGWVLAGALPVALQNDTEWSKLVVQANEKCEDVVIGIGDNAASGYPIWIPRTSEQLCNLVGAWRILQRVRSHRWTTDDLVTAWVAGKHRHVSKYLDLGCGNASVLLMTSWCLLKNGTSNVDTIMGVEARSEAVDLARRSIGFNLISNNSATVVHSDFRDFSTDHKFQLITGTPPYFRVDFNIQDNATVTAAIINQGGMPCKKQSAPARCEFRGGIEAYCVTAAKFLDKSGGRFCVCENWLNHDRVVRAALDSKLRILEQWHIHGREGRPILFAVYVMEHKISDINMETKIHMLVVRTMNGEWTEQYKEQVLKAMNIPVADSYHSKHEIN